MSYFWSPNKGLRKGEEKEGEEEKEKGNQAKVWILVWIHDFCMILVYKVLGYDLLGFSLDINLVPFSRVFLGRQPNSRFKGSLVENP